MFVSGSFGLHVDEEDCSTFDRNNMIRCLPCTDQVSRVLLSWLLNNHFVPYCLPWLIELVHQDCHWLQTT